MEEPFRTYLVSGLAPLVAHQTNLSPNTACSTPLYLSNRIVATARCVWVLFFFSLPVFTVVMDVDCATSKVMIPHPSTNARIIIYLSLKYYSQMIYHQAHNASLVGLASVSLPWSAQVANKVNICGSTFERIDPNGGLFMHWDMEPHCSRQGQYTCLIISWVLLSKRNAKNRDDDGYVRATMTKYVKSAYNNKSQFSYDFR